MSLFLAFMPIWAFRTNAGAPLANGNIFWYDNDARSTKLTVYHDEAGLIPYTNPAALNGRGEIPPFYAGDEKRFYIEVRAPAPAGYPPEEGDLILAIENYSPIDTIVPSATSLRYDNILLNGQFYIYGQNEFSSFSANTPVSVAKFWSFVKNNTTAVDKVQVIPFTLGETDVESSPLNYLRYLCTSPGAGENVKKIYQSIPRVRTFEQQIVTLSFAARSSSSSTIQFFLEQFFGTGGTPSATVTTNISSFNLNPAWQKFNVTFTIPSVATKVLGSNEDDETKFSWGLPLDVACTVDFSDMYVTVGENVYPYPQLNPRIEEALAGSSIPVGSVIPTAAYKSDDGFFMCWGDAVSRADYVELKEKITIPTKGDTANGSTIISNFSMPPVELETGIHLEGAGIPAGATITGYQSTITGNTTNASNTISGIASTSGLLTGWPIEGAGIPAGATIASIVNSTTITISTNATATATGVTLTILAGKIAISAAATASASGVSITIFPWGNGNGSTTFNVPDFRGRMLLGAGAGSGLTKRHLGQKGGDENRQLIIANLPPHQHNYLAATTYTNANNGANDMTVNANPATTTDGSEHGLQSLPFSLMNPFGALNYQIKY